jgi:MFS family permease
LLSKLAAYGIGLAVRPIGSLAFGCLIALRVIQGLALGGEYAGAATYVAEHAPESRRGYYTSFIYLAMMANANPVRPVVLTLLVFAQMVPFVILYAPLAAYLVEASASPSSRASSARST